MAWCEQYHGLIDATKSVFNHPYMHKECFGTLKQQWMYLVVAQHPVPPTERVPSKSDIFHEM